MLKSMRSNIKKLHWVLWIIILSFVLWGVGGISQLGGIPNDVIKSVEGINVSYADFEYSYRRMVSFYAQMYGDQFSPEMVEQLNLKQAALNNVIEEAEKAALAKRAGFSVSDEELSRAIMDIPELQDGEGNFLGRDIYLQVLKMNNLTVSEFESGIKRSLLTEKLNNYFQHTIIPSHADSYQKYIFDNTTRQFAYIDINSKNLAEKVEYTEEELLEYYEANKAKYELQEQRVIDYIVFDPKTYEAGIVNEKDLLNEYYLSHKEEFRQEDEVKASHILFKVDPEDPESLAEAKDKALMIKEELEGGADFGLLARMYSDDPGSKEKSGDLGFFGRGQMVGPFEETAFSMAVGQISEPVQTQFGIHIIKVTDRKEDKILSFEEVKDRIDARLKTIKADRLAQKAAEDFIKDIYSREELIKKAEESEIRPKTTKPFFNRQTIPDLGYAKELVEKAFLASLDIVSEPVKLRNSYYVFSVKEIIQPYIPGLDHEETNKRVIADYRNEKAKELALARAQEVKELLEQDVPLEQVKNLFSELALEQKETGKLTAGAGVPGLNDREKILELFSIHEGEIFGPVPRGDTGQYTLYYLVDSSLPQEDGFEEKREELDDALKSSRGFQVYRAWFDTARKTLKVKTNNELLRYLMEG